VRSRLSRGREALRRLMGVVPDHHAEIIMADPAALRRAAQRFPGRVAATDRHGSPRAHSLRGPAKPARLASSAIN